MFKTLPVGQAVEELFAAVETFLRYQDSNTLLKLHVAATKRFYQKWHNIQQQ